MKPSCSFIVLVVSLASVQPGLAQQGEGDPAVLDQMRQLNEQLAAAGADVALEQIEFYTLGGGRSMNRIHQTGTRWVAGDARRFAQGNDLTYVVDQDDLVSFSGVQAGATEAAIDEAMTTWNNNRCLKKVNVVKTADPGVDITVLDGSVPNPFTNVFLADIVFGGYEFLFPFIALPPQTLAVSATFIFLNSGVPTDINGDNYLDTAFNEVYFAQALLPPPALVVPWGIDAPLPLVDVETVALHESGHSLGIGHFGPPPAALMNAGYAGVRQSPSAVDSAGMCAVWASWPK